MRVIFGTVVMDGWSIMEDNVYNFPIEELSLIECVNLVDPSGDETERLFREMSLLLSGSEVKLIYYVLLTYMNSFLVHCRDNGIDYDAFVGELSDFVDGHRL